MKEEVNKERLLQKYYDGETTLAEEQWLKKDVLHERETVEQHIFKDLDALKKQTFQNAVIPKQRKNQRIRFITICGLVAAACAVLFVWNPLGNNSTSNVLETKIVKEILVSEEHTSELQSRPHLVCRLLLE